MSAELNSLLKISLDELRMQMLGAQVAFGFQFQSRFQDRFDVSDPARRAVALAGLIFMVLTLGLLIAAPAVHRIADAGQASERTLYVAGVRLLPDSPAVAWTAAGAACVLIGFWYALPLGLRVTGEPR